MIKSAALVLFFGLIALVTRQAQANTYSESTLGDFHSVTLTSSDPVANNPTLLTPALSPGINTIKGSSYLSGTGSPDYDFFSFIVPTGDTVTSTLFTTGASDQFDYGTYQDSNGTYYLEQGGTTSLITNGSTKLFAQLFPQPLPAGTYGIGLRNAGSYNTTAPYTVTLSVTPAPATLILLVPGILALMTIREPRDH